MGHTGSNWYLGVFADGALPVVGSIYLEVLVGADLRGAVHSGSALSDPDNAALRFQKAS